MIFAYRVPKYLRSEPNKKYSRCKFGPQCLFVPVSSFWHYIGTLIITVVQWSYRSFRLSDRCICQVVLAISRLFRSLQTKEIKKLKKEKRTEQLPRIAVCSRNRVLLISVPDPPDPHVFVPPGPGSTSQRYGSGSFYYRA
jgi:hypothetical protein